MVYLDRSSTNRPPLSNVTNYTFWKKRNRIYICSINFDLWNIIEKGLHVPSKLLGDRNIPEKLNEYNEDDTKKMTLNFQAMNILCYALDQLNTILLVDAKLLTQFGNCWKSLMNVPIR